jgi:hypothetical protein
VSGECRRLHKDDYEPRLHALEAAVGDFQSGLIGKDEVIARASIYLDFLRGSAGQEGDRDARARSSG